MLDPKKGQGSGARLIKAFREPTRLEVLVGEVDVKNPNTIKYVMPAYLLWSAYKILYSKKSDIENAVEVSGYRENNVIRATGIIKCNMEQQDEVHVRAVGGSDEALQRDWFGAYQVGIFHSHPWPGIQKPSSMDKTAIAQLNRSRDSLGAIFSSDYYVTFFVPEQKSCIVVIKGRYIDNIRGATVRMVPPNSRNI
jgi:hypothetical protein